MLITSRGFEERRDFGTLLRVVQFIREEADGRAGGATTTTTAAGAAAGTEQTVARFEMSTKELVMVVEEEDGLRRLAQKLNGMRIEYCELKEMPKSRGGTEPMEEIGQRRGKTGRRRKMEEGRLEEGRGDNTNKGIIPFELEALMENSKMLFYSCGVEDLDHFARTRHESIRQIGTRVCVELIGII